MPSCTKSKNIGPFFLPFIDFFKLILLVPDYFPPSSILFLGFDLFYRGSAHCCGTEAIICALQMLPNKCDVNLVEEIKPAPCEAESLSLFFSTHPLSLQHNPCSQSSSFFFHLLVHMLPKECSHQMSHKHSAFVCCWVRGHCVYHNLLMYLSSIPTVFPNLTVVDRC